MNLNLSEAENIQSFCALAPDTDLSFDEYWALKANLSNTDILARYYNVAGRVEQFNALWMETIEREDYLALDCVIPKVHASLAFLKTLGPCVMHGPSIRRACDSTAL